MKFSLYRFVSGVLQVFAWIILVVCVIMAIVVVASPGYSWVYYYNMPMGAADMMGMRWVGFLALLLGGISGWAFLLAVAGILTVLISIDQNLSPRYQPSQPTTASGAVCPNCGARVKPGDRFCQACGAKLE